jgi:hypothetical protein
VGTARVKANPQNARNKPARRMYLNFDNIVLSVC